jgi:hypothetical protein
LRGIVWQIRRQFKLNMNGVLENFFLQADEVGVAQNMPTPITDSPD